MWRRIAVILLSTLVSVPVLARGGESSATDDSDTPPKSSAEGSSVRSQMDPAARLSTLFPAAAQISFAVAVVPDPLVPRYRRPYDLDIVALELGMLKDGYILDRFYLPWNAELRQEDVRTAPSASSSSAQRMAPPLEQVPMNYRYGLLVFRCDGWRSAPQLRQANSTNVQGLGLGLGTTCGAPAGTSGALGTRVRALYVVTDTATKGIETEALLCAIDRINSQLPAGAPDGTRTSPRAAGCWPWPEAPEGSAATAAKSPSPGTALLSYPDACHTPQPTATLLVLGPDFSGALDSAGEVGKRLSLGKDLVKQPIRALCLLSSSATDSTNMQANNAWGDALFPVQYDGLALENDRKLRHIARLLPTLIGKQVLAAKSSVAILAEASTYGYGVCGYADDPSHSMPSEVRDLCLSSRRLYFPANIADIRYGMQQDQRRRALENPLKLEMSSGHLSLDLGAENGSEYPESRQSALTSVGIQLALEQVLEELQSDPPKLVIVIATDVRDRLFLFDELRKRLARAMLIDIASDDLIGHPDFLHASRGALAIGSARLTTQGSIYGCEGAPASAARAASRTMSTWSTDFQAILADAVSRLYDPTGERSKPPCDSARFQSRRPVVQVISLEGLKTITQASSQGNDEREGSAPSRGLLLASAQYSAPFFCLSAAWLLIGPLMLSYLRPNPPTRSVALACTNSAAVALCLLYPISAVLVTQSLHRRDHDNLVFMTTLIILGVALGGLAVCIRLVRQAARTAPQVNLRNLVGPILLAFSAAGLAATPWAWYDSFGNSVAAYLDVSALEDIALDPDPGLAFLLLVAVAALVLLYSCVVLATGAGIVNRDSLLLRKERAAESETAGAPAMTIGPRQAVAPPIVAVKVVGATNVALGVPCASTIEPAQTAPTVKSMSVARALQTPRPPSAAQWLPTSHTQPPKRELRGALTLNPFGSLAIAAAAIIVIVAPDLLWGDTRLTIFGPLASQVALLALTATSVSATVLLACSVGMARRITAISRYLTTARKQSASSEAREPREDAVGRWPADVNGPRIFPPTPVVARATDCGAAAKQLLWAEDLTEWRTRVSEWLHQGQNDGAHRSAIFALLATELSLFRWCVLGTVVCALASITAVYLFPIEADLLLELNLLLLVGIGAIAGLAATTFERDGLLSNILCNRPAPRRFSTTLFGFISMPFIALAVALAIAQLPGVVDWGGGVLRLLAGLGLHS